MNECIKIEITKELVDKYTAHYFSLHPKAHKPPITGPTHPSINQWMILQRQAMNTMKQKWKDFSSWVVNYYGYNDYNIDCCRIEVTTFYGRKIRHDADNYVPKFILDGFVDANLLVDDADTNIRSLTLKCRYDKANPRTEILIYREQKEQEE